MLYNIKKTINSFITPASLKCHDMYRSLSQLKAFKYSHEKGTQKLLKALYCMIRFNFFLPISFKVSEWNIFANKRSSMIIPRGVITM